MNEGLFSAYSALPAWKELLASLPQDTCIALAGMAGKALWMSLDGKGL